MRLEFTKRTKLIAWNRCQGRCEGVVDVETGKYIVSDLMHYPGSFRRCNSLLKRGAFIFDHIDPDFFSGCNEITNCAVLCSLCNKDKTAHDQKKIAKSKRNTAKHIGIRRTSRPMIGSKRSGWRHKMDGTWERRT